VETIAIFLWSATPYLLAIVSGMVITNIIHTRHCLLIRLEEIDKKWFQEMINRTDCKTNHDVLRTSISVYYAIVAEQTLGAEPFLIYPDKSAVKIPMKCVEKRS
jgi:hypothetical protein